MEAAIKRVMPNSAEAEAEQSVRFHDHGQRSSHGGIREI